MWYLFTDATFFKQWFKEIRVAWNIGLFCHSRVSHWMHIPLTLFTIYKLVHWSLMHTLRQLRSKNKAKHIAAAIGRELKQFFLKSCRQRIIKKNVLKCLKLPTYLHIACLEKSNEISICCFKNSLSCIENLIFACVYDGNFDLLKLFQQITK